MMPKFICSPSSCLSIRSALFADSASKSPFQQLIQNVLGTTRQLWRGYLQNNSKLPNEIIRKQHRLPPEILKNRKRPTDSSKLANFVYRPGIIYKVTSRWNSNSTTNFSRAELLKRFYRGGSGPLIGFVGFALAKKPSLLTEEEELEGVSYLIRDAFSTLHWEKQELNVDKSGVLSKVSFQDLRIGKLLAKGCNAAIYSAQIYNPKIASIEDDSEMNDLSKEVKMLPFEMSENFINSKFLKKEDDTEFSKLENDNMKNVNLKSFVPNNDVTSDFSLEPGSFGSHDLAVKVMFNYNAESNAYAIYNAMYKETLPAVKNVSLGAAGRHKIRKRRLKPHKNIVKMYSAFADQLPLLPGAVANYPIALPPRLLSEGCGRNMTLFLVMKRYHCCLKDYLKSHAVSPETSLILFTQLLEALVHLLQSGVAHRDLKSDNILLDLSQGIESPKLAVTDFGCCLESLTMSYVSPDIPKGGNVSLMAPEVVNAEPGPFSAIDYTRSDLWAAGAIAYEIFGGKNPFYEDSSLNSANKHALHSGFYKETELPPFPENAPKVIQNLVLSMLRVNPKERPSPSFAASICQIHLHAPPKLLVGTFDAQTCKRTLKWMFQLSAQTYLELSVTKVQNVPVKLELCHTFCSRIQYLQVLKAVEYIMEMQTH